jgi:hypothetical protein
VIKDFVVIVKLSILSKLDSMLDKLRRIRQSIRPALEMLKLLLLRITTGGMVTLLLRITTGINDSIGQFH